MAHVRGVGDTELDLNWLPASSGEPELIDRQTGSTWNWLTGAALSGPMLGQRLEPLSTTPIYWSTWVTFYPQTALW